MLNEVFSDFCPGMIELGGAVSVVTDKDNVVIAKPIEVLTEGFLGN